MNLTTQVQAQEHLNKQLNKRLAERDLELQEVQGKVYHVSNDFLDMIFLI